MAGIINKQANAYEDLQKEIKKTDHASKELLVSFSGGNEEKVLDEKTTRELIKLYPELSKVIKANTSTVKEASAAQEEANAQRVVSSQQKKIDELARYQAELRKINISVRELEDTRQLYSAEHLAEYNKLLSDEIDRQQEYVRIIFKMQEEINKALEPVGRKFLTHGAVVDIPVYISVKEESLKEIPLAVEAAKKTWQEWFGKIAGVDPVLFGESGAKAAEIYISEFEKLLSSRTAIADALGAQLDIAGMLKSRQSDIHNVLKELFEIDPNQINDPFALANESVLLLVASYKSLGAEAKTLEDSLTITDTLERLNREVQNLGKDQYDLALATMTAANATDEQIRQAERLIGTLRGAGQTVKELSAQDVLSDLGREVQNLGKDQYDRALATMAAANATEEEILQAEKLIETLRRYGMSFEELVAHKVSSGLMNIFPELEKQAAQALGNIAAQFAMITFDPMLNGISAVTAAFAKAENASGDAKQAMAQMFQQILNQMPTMFLQAGLQLIAQGQWQLGLGFVAAAATSAIVKGGVQGTIDREKTASANARGNTFDTDGIIPFAKGGSFTNQIVDKPTHFRFGGKLGEMGEAGPEAIIPLKRMSNGDLGVASSSASGTQVTVKIFNYSESEVHQERRENADGSTDIEVVIGGMINRHLSAGKSDRIMNGRFGLRALGV